MVSDLQDLSLDGTWRFALDEDDKGYTESWFIDFPGTETVSLPGSMAENGKGNDVTLDTPWTGRIRDTSFFDDDRYEKYRQPGNIKVPFWLTPVKHYMGAAWYERTFDVPELMAGKQFELYLERPHWTTRIWIDGQEIGFGQSLSTPHAFPVKALSAGDHKITIRIDNRMFVDVGEDAHSMTDHSQTNWNGIIGRIALLPSEVVRFRDVQIHAGFNAKSCPVVCKIENIREESIECELRISIHEKKSGTVVSEVYETLVSFTPGLNDISTDIAITQPIENWDVFNPALYNLRISVESESQVIAESNTSFGFRTFEARGSRFLLNEKPVFLRGTLECCVFPLTGYPPTDKPAWERIMSILKNYGLNHMRFHSWCPPKAAFEAADEAGIIFSAECASWATVGFDEQYEKWLYQEADNVLREYGNHPSFCMMLYGNEPYGFRASAFLAEFVNHYKAQDSCRLFSSGTAWPLIPENEFQVWANPRIQYWDQNLESRINAVPPETTSNYSDYITQYVAPVISHEIGQWCVYPNFDEIPKYSGVLSAYNLEIFRDFLEESGMGGQARDFLMASGKLQVMCYKEEIESALRTDGMGGFQLLDLHDFPGQGTALVGMLDPFWDDKPYANPAEFREFCNAIVPLAEISKRVFNSSETFTASLLVAQFGAADIPAGDINWEITNEGTTVYSGTIATNGLPPTGLQIIGEIEQELVAEKVARKLELSVSLPGNTGSNRWDFWVYPESLKISTPDNVHITAELNDDARGVLRAGGKVLLMPDPDHIKGDHRGQVPAGFSSIFWNTAWTQGQKPHTLGILCDPDHPAFRHFPTEYHSNWQWWYIITNSRSMIMNQLPTEIMPLVQVIDDWFTVRKLGLVFECEMDGGRLLVCSMDLKNETGLDPVCRQMRYSLLQYMIGDDFRPSITLTPKDIDTVIGMEPISSET